MPERREKGGHYRRKMRVKSTAASIFRSRCSGGTRLSVSTISNTPRSIFPRSSIFLTSDPIIPKIVEKAQLSLDFFDNLTSERFNFSDVFRHYSFNGGDKRNRTAELLNAMETSLKI